METYAAYCKDESLRLESSSGGLFSLIAHEVINNGGMVYGVSMTVDCYGAEFLRVTKIEELHKLRGSKYLQAKIGSSYINVKKDLDNGYIVLFTGTQCQINGLSLFLRKTYENLILLDVVCHGVPSPLLWKTYAMYREENIGKIHSINFRCKDIGWSDFGMKENRLFVSKDKDPYMQMFLRNYCLRPSCYECKVKNYKLSDITLGDFWGINEIDSTMDDGIGCSLVIIRTEKGKRIFNNLRDALVTKETKYEESVKYNPCEYKSAKKPEERKNFYVDLKANGFKRVERKYLAITINESIKSKIREMLKRFKNLIGGGISEHSMEQYGLLFTYDIQDR